MRLLATSVLIVLLLSMFVSFAPQPALALDVEVTDCTREGIASAIITAGNGGTVAFDCDPESAIVFGAGAFITITFDVTIDGSVGTERMLLSGAGVSRFFVVQNGATLTARNLIFQNGHDESVGGGAIRVESGATLDVSSCGFLFNSSGVGGGAIDSEGTVRVHQCSFLGNTADSGGAIFSVGPLNVSESSFQQNKAVEGSAEGGAIRSEGVTADISLSYFAENQATFGGALYTNATAGTITTITQSAFFENHASDHGGAITVGDGIMTITASTFGDNTADDQNDGGSAVYVDLFAQANIIAYSTFVQPEGTTPAIGLEGGLTLEGVILGGDGSHCIFVGRGTGGFAVLEDSYTLSNEASCELESADSTENVTNPGLGPLTSTVVDDVLRVHYPLVEGSPAINTGPVTCETPDQLDVVRPFGPACDIGAVEFVENSPPSISTISTNPPSPVEGQNTVVSVVASDVDLDTLAYSFDCTNDDTWEVVDQDSNVHTCIYPDNDSYTIEVRVSDGEDSVTKTQTITVANADPVITTFTVSDDTPQVGQTIALSATASDVEADTLVYTYSCDNQAAYGTSNECTFASGGAHTVWVKVEDEDGGSATRSLGLSVNSAPSITSITFNPEMPNEGVPATVTVIASDADSDALTYWIDCENDGLWDLNGQATNSTTCTYPDNGNYVIIALVSDGTVSTSHVGGVTVANVDPAITSFTASPESLQINQLVTLSVVASDVDADPLTVTYSCDNGMTYGIVNTCSFATGGTHRVGVKVDDGDLGVVTQFLDVFVNSAPSIASIATDPTMPVEGIEATVSVTASDPDSDPLTYSFDCTNDGTWEVEDQDSNIFACTYPDNGNYTLFVRVSDGGVSSTLTQSVTVANAAPLPSSFIASPNPAVVGQLVTLSAAASDVPADFVTYTYACGGGVQVNDTQCRFDAGGEYLVGVLASDEDGGSVSWQIAVSVYLPSTLCANQWNGTLRMIGDGGECGRSEILIQLPVDGPIDLCVNEWNGAARVSETCGRSEYQLTAIGDGSIPVCVNIWNGALRVSESCSRAEVADRI